MSNQYIYINFFSFYNFNRNVKARNLNLIIADNYKMYMFSKKEFLKNLIRIEAIDTKLTWVSIFSKKELEELEKKAASSCR